MPYDPKAVANYFIEVASLEGRKLTPLQIIKLVYIAHGWNLALTGNPLINEPPEAWKYGPVIPSLYHELKIYGNGPVQDKLSEIYVIDDPPGFTIKSRIIPLPDDKSVLSLLKGVWDAYGKLTGSQLSTLTHQSDTPWHQTWEEEGAKYSKGIDIPELSIKNHYLQLKDRNVRQSTVRA